MHAFYLRERLKLPVAMTSATTMSLRRRQALPGKSSLHGDGSSEPGHGRGSTAIPYSRTDAIIANMNAGAGCRTISAPPVIVNVPDYTLKVVDQ
jgi:hypothetical protein